MAGPSSNAKKWLVKSSGMILGPYTIDEIAKDLQSRKVALIDEVRSPDSRWMFIREHSEFAEIVQKFRTSTHDQNENTGTTFVPTKTQTITTSNTAELTITPPPASMSSSTANSEVLEASSADESPRKAAPVYASAQDPKVQGAFKKETKRTALIAWLSVLLLISGFAAYQFLAPKKATKNLGYSDFISLARKHKQTGNFEKSLEFYRRAETIQHLEILDQIDMIPLLMAVENQNLQARQMLETLLGLPEISEKQQHDIDNMIALSYLRDGRLDEAQRRYFEIIQKDPKNEAAQINLAEISVLQGQYDVAAENITALIKTGIKDPVLLLFRILVIYRTVDDKDRLEAAKVDLKRLVNQYQDYKAEMLLVLAAIQKKLNQDLDAADTVRSLVSLDPDLTRLHVHDYMIHREILEWVYLGNICEILAKDENQSPVYAALTAYCSYQQNDLRAALEKVEKAKAQFANDQNLVGLNAFLLYKANRSSEVRGLLQLPKANESDLAHLVKAYLCQDQKDWSCAETTWKAIHQKDSRNLAAFAGLAQVALKNGDADRAMDYLRHGQSISANYRPFLELKGQVNEH